MQQSSTRGVRAGNRHHFRNALFVLGALFAGAPHAYAADCSSGAAAWISLEIEPERVANGEAAEFVEIDQAGCVTSRYASFDKRAGLYRYQLEPGAKGELQSLLARTQLHRLDAPGLRKRLQAQDEAMRAKVEKGQATLQIVSDGDHYRIALDNDGQHNVFEWYAPLQEASWRQNVTDRKSTRLN